MPLTNKLRVLVTDAVHPLLLEGLSEAGFACDYLPDIDGQAVVGLIKPYTGLVVNSKVLVDAAFFEQAPLLKFVGRLGSGMEVIDRAAARLHGVAVCSAPEGNCDAVAEQAIGMLLMQLNHIQRADRQVRAGLWVREPNRGRELGSRVVGIVGFGHTGKAFATRLAGFGCRVLAYDKYLPSGYATDWPHVTACATPENLLSGCDVLSVHLPLTDETYHWLDAGRLSMLQQGTVLVNTSRGTCVDTRALIEALETGHLGGACLDVLENEKPGSYTDSDKELYKRLYKLDNVVLTPHIAGWTQESKRRLAEVLLMKIRQVV
jgi:D-3-phosphoglycerate dehydrogenase